MAGDHCRAGIGVLPRDQQFSTGHEQPAGSGQDAVQTQSIIDEQCQVMAVAEEIGFRIRQTVEAPRMRAPSNQEVFIDLEW